MLHDEVTKVGDAEGQLVPLSSVLGTGPQSAVASNETTHRSLLASNTLASPLEHKGAGNQLTGIESLHFRDE